MNYFIETNFFLMQIYLIILLNLISNKYTFYLEYYLLIYYDYDYKYFYFFYFNCDELYSIFIIYILIIKHKTYLNFCFRI